MESQPQNPEFRNNPENFHPCEFAKQAAKSDRMIGKPCILSVSINSFTKYNNS